MRLRLGLGINVLRRPGRAATGMDAEAPAAERPDNDEAEGDGGDVQPMQAEAEEGS